MPRGEQSDSCGCVQCMASVPCASLVAWILMLVGIGGFTASMIIGVRRNRDLLDDINWLYFIESAVIGICVAVVVVGTFFLIIASLSSGRNSIHVFSTSRKNAFGRALNILCLIFAYVFNIIWILFSCVLMIPVALLVLLRILYEYYNVECINLYHYGFPRNEDICQGNLYVFWEKGKTVLMCYGAAFVASILVAVSMAHFLIAIGANYKHLKETRFATYNGYSDELRASTNSMLETKM